MTLVNEYAGLVTDAAALARKILQDPADDEAKAYFAQAVGERFIEPFDSAVRSALLCCMGEIYRFDMLRFCQPWISLLFGDPELDGFRSAADKSDQSEEALFDWLANASAGDLSFLSDDLFLEGLRLLTISNAPMEGLQSGLRKWFCLNGERLAKESRLASFEPFLIALAEQCFFNEYAYPLGDEERRALKDLDRVERGTGPSARALLALSACYSALVEQFADEAESLRDLSAGSPRFARLVKTQFLDPIEERELARRIASFGDLANRVSAEVRSQYEANPYPRWISAGLLLPAARGQQRSGPCDILVAGCGTGKQVFGTLANFPDSRIVAIDISRASLGYAQRKVREAGFADRVQFLHADILAMESWPDQFDVIECTGVLHHMEDPYLGWQVLTGCLRPGGHFRVGLYSETARTGFVAAQRLAREQAVEPDAEGIRAFRKSILDRPETDPLRNALLEAGDFYTTSALRDLVFHVQEHRFNLLQIEEMLGRLGLTCTNFLVANPNVAREFDRMFPYDRERASLTNWHLFEQRHPATFSGMYEFWCRKDS